jgi:hypothetical protein
MIQGMVVREDDELITGFELLFPRYQVPWALDLRVSCKEDVRMLSTVLMSCSYNPTEWGGRFEAAPYPFVQADGYKRAYYIVTFITGATWTGYCHHTTF